VHQLDDREATNSVRVSKHTDRRQSGSWPHATTIDLLLEQLTAVLIDV